MGPILTSEQIHNIAVDLLEMPRDDAFMRIGGMQVSDADRRRIITEYNELYGAQHTGTPRPMPQETIREIVSELVAMNCDEEARDYIAALEVTDEDRATITELYEKTAAAQSTYLSQQQRDGIVSELLKFPYAEAYDILVAMEIANGDKKLILEAYRRALATRSTADKRYKTAPNIEEINARLEKEKKEYDESMKRASWWHYLVGVVGSVAIFIWLPSLIALVISFFSFFWSAFDAGITMLFAPAISAALGIMLLVTMLPRSAKSWIICIMIILSTIGGIASVNNFLFFNDIFYGIGYAISVAVTIITGVYQIKGEYSNTKFKTSNLVAITLTAIFCAIYAFVVISSNALTYNRYGSALAYWTENGDVYHVDPDCPTLANSEDVYSTSIDEAIFRGKERACEVCS